MNFIGLGFSFFAEDKDVGDTIKSIQSQLEVLDGQLQRLPNTTKKAVGGLSGNEVAANALAGAVGGVRRQLSDLKNTGYDLDVSVFQGYISDAEKAELAAQRVCNEVAAIKACAGTASRALAVMRTEGVAAADSLVAAFKAFGASFPGLGVSDATKDMNNLYRVAAQGNEVLAGLYAAGSGPLQLLRRQLGANQAATIEAATAVRDFRDNLGRIGASSTQIGAVGKKLEALALQGFIGAVKLTRSWKDFSTEFGKLRVAVGNKALFKAFVTAGTKAAEAVVEKIKSVVKVIGDISTALRGVVESDKFLIDVDKAMKTLEGTVGTTKTQFVGMTEAMRNAVAVTGTAPGEMLALSRSLMEVGYSIDELGDKSKGILTTSAQLSKVLEISTEKTAELIQTSKVMDVGVKGFEDLTGAAVGLQKKFKIAGLLQDIPEIMESVHQSSMTLGKGFGTAAQKIMKTAVKVAAALKKYLGKDAVKAMAGITEGMTSTADEIARLQAGMADDVSDKTYLLMEALMRGGKSQAEAFEILKKGPEGAAEALRILGPAYADAAKRGDAFAQRLRLSVQDAFGKEASVAIVKGGKALTDEIEKISKATDGGAEALEKAAVTQAQSLEAQLAAIDGQKEMAKTAFLLNEVLEPMRDVLKTVSGVMNSWAGALIGAGLAIGGLLAPLASLMVYLPSLASIVSGIGAVFGAVFSPIGLIIAGVAVELYALYALWQRTSDLVVPFLEKLWERLGPIPKILGAIVLAMNPIGALGAMVYALYKYWDDFYAAMKPGLDSLSEAWEGIVKTVRDVVTEWDAILGPSTQKSTTTFAEDLGNAFKFVAQVLGSVASAVLQIVGFFVRFLKPTIVMIGALISPYIKLFADLTDSTKSWGDIFWDLVGIVTGPFKAIGRGIWTAVKEWIDILGLPVDEIVFALSYIGKVVKKVAKTLFSPFASSWEWVKDVAGKVWDWLSGKFDWLVDAVSKTAGAIARPFKDAFAFLEDVIGKSFNWIKGAVQRVVQVIMDKLQPLIDKIKIFGGVAKSLWEEFMAEDTPVPAAAGAGAQGWTSVGAAPRAVVDVGTRRPTQTEPMKAMDRVGVQQELTRRAMRGLVEAMPPVGGTHANNSPAGAVAGEVKVSARIVVEPRELARLVTDRIDEQASLQSRRH